MAKYLFTYFGGGMPESEEEQARHMAAWGEWMGANESGWADMGAPCGGSKTVGADDASDGSDHAPGGYGIVEADGFDAACAIAAGCPVVTLSGGTVVVSETFEIPM